MQAPCPRQVIFNSDVKHMDTWARRACTPLTTADEMDATYARAHPWFQYLRNSLIQYHEWKDAPPSDSRMLLSLQRASFHRSSAGFPAGPPLKLELPFKASSFFSPTRRVQWQMVFHSDIFEFARLISPPITDILNLMQCLIPGLVTIVMEERLPEGVFKTTRGLPSVSWIDEHKIQLVEIFGRTRYAALRHSCNDSAAAFKVEKIEVSPYRR